ncbi:spore cortex biosynthesis protein YabQ [Halobacillus sp. A5]|uniref:spore cortex biosynthesis protein YabQ n=1 Tax=Halobacillus sp. A5 TaxID=2880263 RepID=UPI0020A64B94|nr:spore cortex biosynthesis protein YabQ [Halobacillus sp. A5]MCP3029686.1 spore cortex biosynthesis protein YabQ [Halobacillus sp. A5]
MTLTTQFMTMIAMVAGGIYTGAAIDTFERLFRNRNKRSWLEFAWQSAFWMTQAAFLFFLLYSVNYGEIRMYIFVALFCGYAGYRALFQRGYNRILEAGIRVVMGILRFLKRLFDIFIVWPLTTLIIISKNVLIWVYRILYKGIFIVFTVVFYPILLLFRIIWKLLPEKIKKYFLQLAGFYDTIKNIIVNKWNGKDKDE